MNTLNNGSFTRFLSLSSKVGYIYTTFKWEKTNQMLKNESVKFCLHVHPYISTKINIYN